MIIELYNTRSRKKEKFSPLSAHTAKLYACGPTVYNFAHIGNLRTYLFEDFLRRSLDFAGYEVQHVMNITDVGHLTDDGDAGEDKMVLAARKQGMSVWQIAEHFTKAFFDDCKRLNILVPTTVCKATDHIADMIEMISGLEKKGFTYVANGNVYFDTKKFASYGKMALIDRNEGEGQHRVQVDEGKKNPEDFVLWFTKSKFENQAMQWDSPWGKGYPGWHIECSAMSVKYLGEKIDIHCGGIDHVRVHHTNEIAQSEAFLGVEPWVNFWIHGEFLVIDKKKMAKSDGNITTIQSLIDQGFDPLDYRYLCLQAHYRTQLNFSTEVLEAARIGRKNLTQKIADLLLNAEPEAQSKNDAYAADFVSAISDDLHTPKAMAILQKMVKDEEVSPGRRLGFVDLFDQVLGLSLIAEAQKTLTEKSNIGDDEKSKIETLIEERAQARNDKNFARSDEIRNILSSMGVTLFDGPQGTRYEKK